MCRFLDTGFQTYDIEVRDAVLACGQALVELKVLRGHPLRRETRPGGFPAGIAVNSIDAAHRCRHLLNI